MPDRIRLKDKVAIVTGASCGVGREAARILTCRGARLVAVDDDMDVLRQLAEVLPADARWIAVSANVADELAVADYVARARVEFGRIDILFNAAGIEPADVPIHETRRDDFQRIFVTNATSVFLGMKHVIPVMAEGGGGAIVNRCSVAAYRPGPQQIAHAAASAAVMGMTRTAALEWGEAGIRVNCVNPGQAASDEAVASLAAFLISSEASFITGAVYPLDGGVTS